MQDYRFSSRVERLEDGLRMHVVPVPDEIAGELRAHGVRRVLGTIDGHEFGRALQGPQETGQYFMFGQSFLREFTLKLGDPVDLVVWPDPDPDAVEISAEFEAVLEQDEAAAGRWNGMTPGKRRSLAIYVDRAKRSETRLKRAMEIALKMRSYTLYGDKPKGN